MPALTRQACQALDAQDPLRPLRDLFELPEGLIYLDGNSLGAAPKATAARLARAVREEWAQGLIRSWNEAGWYELPRRAGDKLAPFIGARPGEVVCTDTTSVNLHKALSAALALATQDAPQRRRVIGERSDFPTDLYIAQALCQERAYTLQLVDAKDIPGILASEAGQDVAVLMLTHVNYRSGAMHDMQALTAAAHAAGALTVWDLCHSAGAVPVDLHGADADYAVGCSYKYLNGGPGAPAFIWSHPRLEAHLRSPFQQPLTGWWSHAQPFAFTPEYQPATGSARFLCGTPPILSMTALDCGLDTLVAAEPFGGMSALRAKSLALTDLFIRLVEERCGGHGLTLITPREHRSRGSQVSLSRAEGAYAIVQALI
ncbi:kynureninase, partial [Leptospira sp. 96542]|nr:kynureninase [Leptospira sp. 96542]